MNFLYILFFFFSTMFFLNTSPLFYGAFDFLRVPVGFKSVAIQGMLTVICVIIFVRNRDKTQIIRQLIRLLYLWIPWLIYLFIRCDFSDPYSLKKFGLICLVQFLSVVMVCIVFLNNPDKFNKYFFPCTIVLSSLLLFNFFLNPVKEIYSGHVERLTFEYINPIWLSRSFGIGVLCVMLLRKSSWWIKLIALALFGYGMIRTGSRGPLFSLLLVMSSLYIWRRTRLLKLAIRSFVLLCFFVPLLWIAIPLVKGPTANYFSRGSSEGMIAQSGRLQGIYSATKEFSSAPVFGVGLGQYGKINKPYHFKSTININRAEKKCIRQYPHNIFFEVLAELGIAGTFLLLLLLKPGKWIFNLSNKYNYLFVLCFLFSLTSGDLIGNTGVFIFNCIARLSSDDPSPNSLI